MIEKIKDLLIDEKLNHEIEIGRHPDSCCKSEKDIATNYDNVVKKYSEKIKILQAKSCDCLYFNAKKNELVFIEMRGLKEFFARKKGEFTIQTFNKFLEERLDQDGFADKIIDSFNILLMIIGNNENVDKNIYSYLSKNLKSDHIKIRFIILTDISNDDWNTCFLANPDHFTRKLKFRFLTNVGIVRCDDLSTFLN
jgi:hypothetical protein